ncbi:MAG: hypothetical protein UU21_C0006G0008 [Candidatus Levybacteria bacterium GW2011_GWA2_40_8]|nr:MAG: hypothetical protein UU21_C0006G0008 [Candidatus Levybacteria bacterium GW2011_GWA2_40_8]
MNTSIINSSSHYPIQTISSPLRGAMIDEKDFYSFISTKEGLADNSIKNCIKTLRHINKWFFDKDTAKTEDNRVIFLRDLRLSKKPNQILSSLPLRKLKLY